MNIGDAFISAKNAIEYTYAHQTPVLDDTGNGIGNEANDGNLAKLTRVGNGVTAADGRYTGTYTDFSARGTYQVAVYARDAFGNLSFPVGTSVTQEWNLKKIDITGLHLSESPRVNRPVRITATARHSGDASLYYRFSVHPDYGTDHYTGIDWAGMTASEWVTENGIDYIFDRPGEFVVVVWVSDSTQGVRPDGVPIAGLSVRVE